MQIKLNKFNEFISILTLPVPNNYPINCYLVNGHNGYTLIDTGQYFEGIEAGLESVLVQLDKPIVKIIATHSHPDHVGCIKFIKAYFDSEVLLFKGSLDLIYYLKSTRDSQEENQQNILDKIEVSQIDGAVEMFHTDCYDFEPTTTFEEGDVLEIGHLLCEVIFTPGHSVDHVSFYNKEYGWLFCGDIIAQDFYPVILMDGSDMNPLNSFFEKINNLEGKRVDIAFPGHGEIITTFNERLEETKNYHVQFAANMLVLLESGSLTTLEMVEMMNPSKPIRRLHIKLMRAITYLFYLESQKKIKKNEQNGKYYFEKI